MNLEELVVKVGGKAVKISVGNKGFSIKTGMDNLSLHELHYLISIVYTCVGAGIYEKKLTALEIANESYERYIEYHNTMKKRRMN